MPRARMGVREPGPSHYRALKALCPELVSRSGLSDYLRHTSVLTFLAPSDVAAVYTTAAEA